jgi:hypothetical protein
MTYNELKKTVHRFQSIEQPLSTMTLPATAAVTPA